MFLTNSLAVSISMGFLANCFPCTSHYYSRSESLVGMEYHLFISVSKHLVYTQIVTPQCLASAKQGHLCAM